MRHGVSLINLLYVNMELDTAKNYYITRSKQIIDATESMAKDSYGIIEQFKRNKVTKYKEKLTEYYNWLREYDAVYSAHLSISGTINELQIKQSQAIIVEQARNLFISSLRNYENEISNIENSLNFRLTTGIAIIAMVISVLGLI